MKQQLRILHIVQGMNRGGIETMLMNLYRNINRDIIQFDFMLSCIEKSDFEDEILDLGGKIFRMSPISILAPNKYLKDVNHFFKENPNYKIVHAHMSAVSVFPLYFAKKHHIPVRISHSHNNKAFGIKGILKNILKYPLKSMANYYFACSADAANFLYGKWFFKSPNCYILNNAINAELYIYNPVIRHHIREHYNINSKILIGHVGRFISVKNHAFILDVFKSVYDKDSNTVLMLVGDGGLRVQIEKKISTLGLADSVILTGVQPNVYDYLQAIDVFLFPSFFEGLGMSLIEAQTAGLKCFASDSIPVEARVTNLVEFISLAENSNVWADKILGLGNKYKSENTMNQFRSAGYDLKTSSKWIANFYIEKSNELLKVVNTNIKI